MILSDVVTAHIIINKTENEKSKFKVVITEIGDDVTKPVSVSVKKRKLRKALLTATKKYIKTINRQVYSPSPATIVYNQTTENGALCDQKS